MKKKIWVFRRLPSAVMELLEKHFEVDCNPRDRGISREELLMMVKGRDGLLPLLTDRIDGEVMEALRDGQIAGAGLDVFEHESAIHPALFPKDY